MITEEQYTEIMTNYGFTVKDLLKLGNYPKNEILYGHMTRKVDLNDNTGSMYIVNDELSYLKHECYVKTYTKIKICGNKIIVYGDQKKVTEVEELKNIMIPLSKRYKELKEQLKLKKIGKMF